MSPEKTPTLYVPNNAFDEKKDKYKCCTKTFTTWVLSALLIALFVALMMHFLFPVIESSYKTDFDVVRVNEGMSIHVRTQPDKEGALEETTDEPWHLDFLINPTRLCDTVELPNTEAYKKNPEVKLLMLVPSATDHFAQRKAIRKTWGSVADKPHGPMRLGFVLGTTPNTTEEDLISQESQAFGDIIQADFEDTYRNLTTKSVLMLKWVSKHCPHAQYFLKTDDDTFVNLSILSEVLQKFTPGERFIGGYIHRGAQPSRGPSQKYFVSESDYPYEEYPPYVSGSAYVTTGSTAAQLFEASKEVRPVLPMEDVYVTGLCAEEIAADLVHEPCFRYQELSQPSSLDSFRSLATIHSVSPDDMDKLWNEMTKVIFDAFHFPDEDFFSSVDTSSESTSIFDFFNLFDAPRGKNPAKDARVNNQNPISSLDSSINQNPFSSLESSINQNPFSSLDSSVNQNPFSSLDSSSDSMSISDLSDLANWPLGRSSESRWMSRSGVSNAESRLLNLLMGNRGNLGASNWRDGLGSPMTRDGQAQQNLPNWPGSQSSQVPFQESKLQLPMTWQRTYIVPLPLNRIGGNGFNLTEYLLK